VPAFLKAKGHWFQPSCAHQRSTRSAPVSIGAIPFRASSVPDAPVLFDHMSSHLYLQPRRCSRGKGRASRTTGTTPVSRKGQDTPESAHAKRAVSRTATWEPGRLPGA